MPPYIPTNNITELNELIYAGAKLVCEKLGISSKSTKKTVKTGMENSTGNANNKTMKISQNDLKKKGGTEISWTKKEQATQEKIIVQLEEINQKVLAKEGRLKRYRQRVKRYRQNRTFQNNEKNSINN